MQKKLRILLIVFASIFLISSGIYLIFFPSFVKQGWSGVIATDATWEGNILVSGDVIVAPWVTLTVKPGTHVKIMAHHDDLNFIRMHQSDVDDLTTGDPTADPAVGGNDYQAHHISIVVAGKLICKGTASNPIRFTSTSDSPSYVDWWGINAKYAEFEYTSIEWCVTPIYSANGFERLTIDHCYFAHTWAAAVGFMEPADYSTSLAYVKHTTILDAGHEAIDTHSSGNVEIAYNYVESSQVGLNLRDDAIDIEGHYLNVSAHHNIIIDTGLPVLCAGANVFLTQSVFQSLNQNTTRWTYQGWQMPLVGGNQVAVFMAPEMVGSLIVTNSIIFDSLYGVSNDNPQSTLNNGYLNFDGVSTPFGSNVLPGTGILNIASMFVDKNARDFHLQGGSPLKNAGNPLDGTPDLGAYGGAQAESEIGWWY